jgi:hypothetical protein
MTAADVEGSQIGRRVVTNRGARDSLGLGHTLGPIRLVLGIGYDFLPSPPRTLREVAQTVLGYLYPWEAEVPHWR